MTARNSENRDVRSAPVPSPDAIRQAGRWAAEVWQDTIDGAWSWAIVTTADTGHRTVQEDNFDRPCRTRAAAVKAVTRLCDRDYAGVLGAAVAR